VHPGIDTVVILVIACHAAHGTFNTTLPAGSVCTGRRGCVIPDLLIDRSNMMVPHRCAAVLGLIVAALLTSSGSAERPQGGVPPSATYKLANGLRVVLAPDAAAAGVALVVAYDAGSAHDPRDYPGLAHLVEHLTFRGSSHVRPLRGIDDVLESVGGGWGAYTELERTVYLSSLSVRGLETALWAESERMAFALNGIDQAALDIERRVVKNEYDEREGRRGLQVWWQHQRSLYGETHPFVAAESEARVAVGEISLRDVQWFFQSVYRPDNATLVVAGSFQLEGARRLIEKYFGTIKNSAQRPITLEAAPPKLCGVHRVELGHRFLIGHQLIMTWPVPKPSTPAARTQLEALRLLLRWTLRPALVEDSYEATDLYVGLEHYRTHSLLSVELTLNELREWEQVERHVAKLAAGLAEKVQDGATLQTLRSTLLSRAVRSRESAMSRALGILEGDDLGAHIDALASLDAASVRHVTRYLKGPRLTVSARPADRVHDQIAVLDEENPCP
jgi:zinc protease